MAFNLKLPFKNKSGHDAPEMSNDNAQLVANLHGSHYDAAANGRAFTGSSAEAGIAIINAATGGGHPTLWNPTGSGVNLSIIRMEMAWASGGVRPC